MIPILLLCAMLSEASPQTAPTPVIHNDRVTVWGVGGATPTARTLDAVEVSLSGSAAFVPKGKSSNVTERSIVIDLKDNPVAPIANTSGYPMAFPRPGSKKILENERVIVWDYTWTPASPHPCTFTIKTS